MPVDLSNPEQDKKIAHWNRLYRASLLSLAVLILILTAIGVRRVFIVSNQLKESISQGQTTRNKQTKDTQGYIKCIILLRYTHPELNPKSTQKQVEMALDDCAKVSK